jgi:hypothetical protein
LKKISSIKIWTLYPKAVIYQDEDADEDDDEDDEDDEVEDPRMLSKWGISMASMGSMDEDDDSSSGDDDSDFGQVEDAIRNIDIDDDAKYNGESII